MINVHDCFLYHHSSRRRRNWDDIFEKDYDEYANAQAVKHGNGRGNLLDSEDDPIPIPPNTNSEPKPYVYGLVGSKPALSPPSMSAGLQDASGFTERSRTLSETPLMANNGISSAASSRPTTSTSMRHSQSLGAPSVAGRSASPGPLGVLIDTGPELASSASAGGQLLPDSPTSPTHQRKLFVANMDPATDSPSSPASFDMKRRSLNQPGVSSFAGAMAGSSAAAAAPPGLSSYPEDKKEDIGRSSSMSTQSVYSQASTPQAPVIVHKDAGPVSPPLYRD